jgi:O-antigen ligase
MTEVSTTAVFVLLACAALAERLLPTTSPGNRVVPLMFVLAAAPCAFTKIELPISSAANNSILLVAVLLVLGDGVLRYWRPAKATRESGFGGS